MWIGAVTATFGCAPPLAPRAPPSAPAPAPAPAPVDPAPQPGPLALSYSPPTESMNAGWCKGTVPANVAALLADLELTLADVAERVPCGSADYDGDGAVDYAFAAEEAGHCTRHVGVDLVFAMGPDGARTQRLSHPDAEGCFHPGVLHEGPAFPGGSPAIQRPGGSPAIRYLGEGSGDWAVVYHGGQMQVVLTAQGD